MKLITTLALFGLLAGGSAQAACEFDIEAGSNMAFDVTEMSVEQSCDEVTVNLSNTSDLPANAMGHNWVLSLADDLQPVAMDGQSAGLDNHYVKPDDERVIAHTDIIGGGETTSVTFSVADLEPDSEYMFFCTFPGHWSVMQGALVVS